MYGIVILIITFILNVNCNNLQHLDVLMPGIRPTKVSGTDKNKGCIMFQKVFFFQDLSLFSSWSFPLFLNKGPFHICKNN